MRIFLAFILIHFSAWAQIPDTLAINQIVLNNVDTSKTMGLAVGIIKQDSTYFRFFGRMNQSGNTSPDAFTGFEIGGVSTVFTSAYVAFLQHENKLQFSDSVFSKTTIHSLLSHTSGLPSLPNRYGQYQQKMNAPHDNFSYADVENEIQQTVCTNEKYRFSHYGYAVLGLYLQKKWNGAFEKQMQDFIKTQLNLNHTSYSGMSDLTMATPYDLKGDETTFWHASGMNPALGLRSNMYDLSTFCKLFFEEKNDWLQTTLVTRARTDKAILTACYGWHKAQLNNKKPAFYIAKGRTEGYYSFILLDTKNHCAIIILANGCAPIDNLSYDLYDYVINLD